jgi:hypothetical protein
MLLEPAVMETIADETEEEEEEVDGESMIREGIAVIPSTAKIFGTALS